LFIALGVGIFASSGKHVGKHVNMQRSVVLTRSLAAGRFGAAFEVEHVCASNGCSSMQQQQQQQQQQRRSMSMKVYTKTGDKGTSMLFSGERRPKVRAVYASNSHKSKAVLSRMTLCSWHLEILTSLMVSSVFHEHLKRALTGYVQG
jgi:hypothetical protein